VPIRHLASEIPADLEAIVTGRLETNPGRRYASARALADNLQRFLDSDPVEARHLSVIYLLFRKAKAAPRAARAALSHAPDTRCHGLVTDVPRVEHCRNRGPGRTRGDDDSIA
jgi:hypothetical protein